MRDAPASRRCVALKPMTLRTSYLIAKTILYTSAKLYMISDFWIIRNLCFTLNAFNYLFTRIIHREDARQYLYHFG
jgi:hypothetical protein